MPDVQKADGFGFMRLLQRYGTERVEKAEMTLYHINPVAKPRQTRSDKWKKRPCVMKYRAFADEVRARNISMPQPCKIVFYIPMPESWSKKHKAEMESQPHFLKPDLDNLLKALMDAIFEDDSGIWSVCVEKKWAFKGAIGIWEKP